MLRLRDECVLVKQCEKVMAFLETSQDLANKARVGMVKLEHIYYKADSLYAKTKEALKGKPEQLKELWFPSTDSKSEVQALVDMAFEHCAHKVRVKAVCLQLYHLAIHNHFFEARDLVLRTRLNHSIHKHKIPVQILYNRALTQIALAAFRLGQFNECD
jgi:translation initiation factor 3 subunit C